MIRLGDFRDPQNTTLTAFYCLLLFLVLLLHFLFFFFYLYDDGRGSVWKILSRSHITLTHNSKVSTAQRSRDCGS